MCVCVCVCVCIHVLMWVGKAGRVLEPACRISAQMELFSSRNTSHKHDSKDPKSSMVTLT